METLCWEHSAVVENAANTIKNMSLYLHMKHHDSSCSSIQSLQTNEIMLAVSEGNNQQKSL